MNRFFSIQETVSSSKQNKCHFLVDFGDNIHSLEIFRCFSKQIAGNKITSEDKATKFFFMAVFFFLMLHEPSVSAYIAQVPLRLNVNSVRYKRGKAMHWEPFPCNPQVVNLKGVSHFSSFNYFPVKAPTGNFTESQSGWDWKISGSHLVQILYSGRVT